MSLGSLALPFHTADAAASLQYSGSLPKLQPEAIWSDYSSQARAPPLYYPIHSE